MEIEKPVIEGRLVRRYKRFLADIELEDGEVIVAHCPNTGRLEGCKEAGSRVILRDSQDPKRKLRYTFQTIEVDGTWVNVDTSLPNALVAEAIQAGQVPGLTDFESLRREVKYGKSSRIDILLEGSEGQKTYVEVKSTTLAEGDVALFPDAVTERGRKHLIELADMAAEGHRAVIFFLVSRVDVQSFRPADRVDPEYGRVLRDVLQRGVEAMAYACKVQPRSLEISHRLKIELP